jgi:hypothetical protein
MKSILDSRFKYIPAAKTDLRKTFARIKKELAEKEKAPRIIIPISRAK